MPALRIATWNLERPSVRSWKRLPRQLERMKAIEADIWVLTETRASIAPGDGYLGVHSPPHPLRRADEDERYVSIWSRWPLKATGLPADPRGTASAIVETPDGPVIVYGTVIPYANDVDGQEPTGMWQSHYRAIARQGADWRELRQRHPQAEMVVAGDFNQDRDGSGWYGTHRGRALLSEELDRAGLTCITEEDVVEAGKLRTHHLVDHIAVSDTLLTQAAIEVSCGEPKDADGTRLSDHPTVVVDLTRDGGRRPQATGATTRAAPLDPAPTHEMLEVVKQGLEASFSELATEAATMPLELWNESVFRYFYARSIARAHPDVVQAIEVDRIDLVLRRGPTVALLEFKFYIHRRRLELYRGTQRGYKGGPSARNLAEFRDCIDHLSRRPDHPGLSKFVILVYADPLDAGATNPRYADYLDDYVHANQDAHLVEVAAFGPLEISASLLQARLFEVS